MNPNELHSTLICTKEGANSLNRNMNKKKTREEEPRDEGREWEDDGEAHVKRTQKIILRARAALIPTTSAEQAWTVSFLYFFLVLFHFASCLGEERERGMVVVSPGSKWMKKRIENHNKVKEHSDSPHCGGSKTCLHRPG